MTGAKVPARWGLRMGCDSTDAGELVRLRRTSVVADYPARTRTRTRTRTRKQSDDLEYEYEYRDAEYEYDPTAQIAPNRRGSISLTRTLAAVPDAQAQSSSLFLCVLCVLCGSLLFSLWCLARFIRGSRFRPRPRLLGLHCCTSFTCTTCAGRQSELNPIRAKLPNHLSPSECPHWKRVNAEFSAARSSPRGRGRNRYRNRCLPGVSECLLAVSA